MDTLAYGLHTLFKTDTLLASPPKRDVDSSDASVQHKHP